ncbi:hypothetical protein LINPERPRIM_LOCUS18373, partial [Linum perenne]
MISSSSPLHTWQIEESPHLLLLQRFRDVARRTLLKALQTKNVIRIMDRKTIMLFGLCLLVSFLCYNPTTHVLSNA